MKLETLPKLFVSVDDEKDMASHLKSKKAIKDSKELIKGKAQMEQKIIQEFKNA
jgi:hypothetical protein